MKRNAKMYMVLLFGDVEYVHAYFFDDYIWALRFATLDISWNSNAQIYEWRDDRYVLSQIVERR